ncbi:cytochrome P450 [Amycolatopsis pithecellobii]|uniref:Cytochrome P450 n=1 Tax=Amycolatopsis pithecellobii TaxID=664692 RepID=A0A6N7Z5H9_9PSEU|nr:cytochrome P450 [Amycolatopsis pithecellobii]MTD55790.1 cytochrome P450 [Amycolatopsis pithecellobii]
MTSTAPRTARSTVDPFAAEVAADPYPYYRELRNSGPVVYLEKHDVYALTRYADVRAALRDWETFTSAKGTAFNPVMNQQVRGLVLTAEPPEHGALRGALLERLKPSSVHGYANWFEQKAAEMVTPLVERGTFDAVNELAQPFLATILTELIGFPHELTDKFVAGSTAAFLAMGPMNERTDNALAVIQDVMSTIAGITRADLAPGSMGESLYRAAERGEIPDEYVGNLLFDYVGPAFDTTTHAIGNLIWALARNPGQLTILRAEPALIPRAVDEILRYQPPIQIWGRFCRKDTEFGDMTVPGGSRVAIVLGSANRDERHYSDPDIFDVRRTARDHLGLGYGMHRCTGASLAHLEIEAVLRALLERMDRIELGKSRRLLNHTVRGFDRLEVRAG